MAPPGENDPSELCVGASMAQSAVQSEPLSPPSPPAAQRPRAVPGVRWRPLLLGSLAGLLYVAGFPGGDWHRFTFVLGLVAFVPAVLGTRGLGLRGALLVGGAMGLVSHLIAYHWLIHLLREFAGLPWPLAALGWVLLCLAQGASFGVGVAAAHWLRQRTGWPWAATLAVGLTAMDFVYPLLFPSYVANTLGGATWLMQGADVFGVLGGTALVGVVNGALADWLEARRDKRAAPRRVLAGAALLLVVWTGYGAVRSAQVDADASAAEKLEVGLVQHNLGGMANLTDRREGLLRLVRGTRDLAGRGADLVVWPEGALSRIVQEGRTNVVDEVLGGLRQPLLFGATRVQLDERGDRIPYNSAFISDASGEVSGSYDKTVLLAMGEYIPGDWLYPDIYRLIPAASRWGRGTRTAPLELGSWRLGTYICYEDIIPRHVQKLMAERDGARPDVMVNITNDSWYGHTTEPAIHLSLATWRAVEHRRALVRSTNTGVSAIVDPAGRVVAQTGMQEEATLLAPVPRMTGRTVYQVIGDVAGWASLALLAAGGGLARRRSSTAA